MKVAFYTFEHIHTDEVKAEIKEAFAAILDKGNFINGEQVGEFEKAFADFSGAKYAVGMSNGLDALRVALKAMDVQPEDEVMVPSNTFIATWLAVSDIGAKIVPVEPDANTYNIDPARIEEKITSKTKAIIPVHLYGQACDMDAIMEIAQKHNLAVLEDNSQSQGATWKGQPTGGIGDAAATSLYPGKNLGALGDAGIITTNSAQLAEKARMVGNYGSSKKYYHDLLGGNCRLDTIHAAALSVKLKNLPTLNQQRSDIASYYLEHLNGTDGLILPVIAEGATSVWHQFVIRTKKRDELQQFLADHGVGTLIHYPVAPHLQECYDDLGFKKGDFSIAEEIADTCLSLPIWPGLSEEQLAYVVSVIRRFDNL